MGDTVRFVDPADPAQGLTFDGRIAEDFKMSSGTWVRVGALRPRIVAHFAPYLRDAVITGHNRSELGMLAIPDLDVCRRLCADLPDDAPPQAIVSHPAVKSRVRAALNSFNDGATGSTTRICRAILLATPLSLDAQEITDKGSLNQHAILTRRSALVDELYSVMPAAEVIAYEE
jgi:feruloyl-CoA synthase